MSLLAKKFKKIDNVYAEKMYIGVYANNRIFITIYFFRISRSSSQHLNFEAQLNFACELLMSF